MASKSRWRRSSAVALLLLCGAAPAGAAEPKALPDGFVRLREIAPDIQQDIRYASVFNFTAGVVPGYTRAECVLTRPAASALVRADKDLRAKGYALKVYDCYRPARAVAHFMAWMSKSGRADMQGVFLPNVERSKLDALGYVSPKSSHSAGSTVDVGLVRVGDAPLPTPAKAGRCDGAMSERPAESSLDLGTSFDCFSPASAYAAKSVGDGARTNRTILRDAMIAAGFAPYDREWWHFRLRDEPFPGRAFDFEVE